MTCALPSLSTTVVESGGGLTTTVLRSVVPQAAKARQARKTAIAERMEISLLLSTQENALFPRKFLQVTPQPWTRQSV
jgi:hypothetical protein